MLKEYLKNLSIPDKPGVYFFLNKRKIIYIGKATSLRSRTRSYFSPDLIKTRGVITVDMVAKADSLKWEETDSVLEALILEANLIKKYKPYHNIREKDDKSFNFVVITREETPKVLVIRERNLKTSLVEKLKSVKFQARYGPFTNGMQLREAMKIIRQIFPYIDAQSAKPDSFEFYRQIGLAPEVGTEEAKEAYDRNIKNLKLFFQGKKKKVVLNFKKEMNLYAKNREFERAAEMKRRIFALTHVNDVALLKNDTSSARISAGHTRIEAYDIAHMSGKNMVGVMTVVENGEAIKSEYRMFKIRTQSNTNDTGALKEVLERRFNHPEWPMPSLVVVDGGVAQINAAKGALADQGLNIPVVSVLKDERHKPKDILGDEIYAKEYKSSILLANSEAHRFGISYHKNLRGRNFLPGLKNRRER